jgi:hypothetical protein
VDFTDFIRLSRAGQYCIRTSPEEKRGKIQNGAIDDQA